MLRRLLLTALIAGLAAGAVATVAQAVLVWPQIEKAEAIEISRTAASPAATPSAAPATAASHDHPAGAPIAPGWITASLANVVVGVGFALLLAGGLLLGRSAGGAARGVVWGCGGFLAFAAAPALVLPALPPGVEAGDLTMRQLIWVGTAAVTAAGLLLAALARPVWLRACGLAAIVAPHLLVGFVLPDAGALPAMATELAALRARYLLGLFIAAALFWLTLGAMGGAAWARLGRS